MWSRLMDDFERIKNLGRVTPWCRALTVGNVRTWTYEVAKWGNGDTYSSINNPAYGEVVKQKSLEYNEAPRIEQKTFHEHLPCPAYQGHKRQDEFKLTPPFEAGGIVHVVSRGVEATGRFERPVTLENKVAGKTHGIEISFPKGKLFDLVNSRAGKLRTDEGIDHGEYTLAYYSAGHDRDTVRLVRVD
jgi:hypothetical protein